MTPKLLRLAYACEFLLGIVAIFTAWSEIGRPSGARSHYWAWKLGFGLALAIAIVALTATGSF